MVKTCVAIESVNSASCALQVHQTHPSWITWKTEWATVSGPCIEWSHAHHGQFGHDQVESIPKRLIEESVAQALSSARQATKARVDCIYRVQAR